MHIYVRIPCIHIMLSCAVMYSHSARAGPYGGRPGSPRQEKSAPGFGEREREKQVRFAPTPLGVTHQRGNTKRFYSDSYSGGMY